MRGLPLPHQAYILIENMNYLTIKCCSYQYVMSNFLGFLN